VELGPELRQFIADSNIDSVESLEILLLLRRSEAYWSAEAVAQQLGIGRQPAAQKLAALAKAQLLVIGGDTGAYRYAPRAERLRAAADELAAAYDEQRIPVINAIYSANLERLRAFSDAFRLKKE